MDQALGHEDRALTPLEQRRSRLRDFGDGLIDTIEAIDRPDSFIEVERAAQGHGPGVKLRSGFPLCGCPIGTIRALRAPRSALQSRRRWRKR